MTTMVRVSVVVETINARTDAPASELPDSVAGTMAALERQTFRDFEILIVIDDEVSAATADALRQRYPHARHVHARAANYFAHKNAGARAANGEIVVQLDSDCEPDAHWLHVISERFEPGIAAIAGRTRYSGESLAARTFTVPDFANVISTYGDAASGFNLNNVAFRRDVIVTHPFDERIRRNGGCYLAYHQMRREGLRVVYEPRASSQHNLDKRPMVGFAKKHFDRGYDGISVYRYDERGVLKGTRLFRRFGAPVLVAFTGRRIVLDWMRMAKHRRQIGISLATLPYYCAVAAGTRLIELVGGFAAMTKR